MYAKTTQNSLHIQISSIACQDINTNRNTRSWRKSQRTFLQWVFVYRHSLVAGNGTSWETKTISFSSHQWRKVLWLFRQERAFRLVLISWHAMDEIWMWRLFWVVLAYIYLIKKKNSPLPCVVTRYQHQQECPFLTKKWKNFPPLKIKTTRMCNRICKMYIYLYY